jgi:hypothetical protein
MTEPTMVCPITEQELPNLTTLRTLMLEPQEAKSSCD